MVVAQDDFDEPHSSVAARVLPWLVGIVILAAIGWFLYTQMNSRQGVRVEENKPTTIDMLPPPPPPPPPPPEPEIKPPPEPTPETPTPAPTPNPTPEAPAPMQIDGPAQAGADAFGVGAGSGSGSGAPGGTGTCLGSNCGGGPGGAFSDGFYKRYLSSALQERLDRNDKVNRQVFSAELLITITPDGRVTKVEVVRGTGKTDRDDLIQATLAAVQNLDAPPQSMKMPQRIAVRGRRSV